MTTSAPCDFDRLHLFSPRPIQFRKMRTLEDGWRLKEYTIVFGERPLDERDLSFGVDLAMRSLPRPATIPGRPGAGFLVLHQGRGAAYVVLGWWDNENELPLRIFVRPYDQPLWRPASERESICVWDLEVLWFERNAYVQTMLSGSGNIEAYCGMRLGC